MRDDRPRKLAALESLRGVAALSVLIYHVAALNPRRWIAAEWDPVVAPLGLYGVPLFFVLSAFVLWHGYADGGRVRGGVIHFYRRRFFRIAPLYYLLLIVHIVFIVDAETTRQGIASAAMMTFGLVPGHGAGLVMASWSIGVEIIFYAVFPLLVWGIRSWYGIVILFVATALAAGLIGQPLSTDGLLSDTNRWTTADFDLYVFLGYHAVFFVAGTAAAMAFARLPRDDRGRARRLGRTLLYASFVALVALIALNADNVLRWRFVWAVLLAAFVFAVAVRPPRLLLHPAAQWVGVRSFSIYLVHPVVIVGLQRAGVFTGIDRSLGWLGYSVAVLITLVITLAVSALTYRWVERPGMSLGGSSAIDASVGRNAKTPA